MAAGLRFHTEAGLLTSFITALPFPVSQWFARPLPYTVTASLRIRTGFPFHLLLSRHLCATTLYFSRQRDYITFCRIVNPFYGGFVQNVSKAAPHNCVCESQPSFCSTSAVPKMGNIAQPLPAQAGLRMRHTPCGYMQYSSGLETLIWHKIFCCASLPNCAVLP